MGCVEGEGVAGWMVLQQQKLPIRFAQGRSLPQGVDQVACGGDVGASKGEEGGMVAGAVVARVVGVCGGDWEQQQKGQHHQRKQGTVRIGISNGATDLSMV